MILETYVRVFVEPDALDATVTFYRTLLDGHDSLRFSDPDTHLELAAVSSPTLSVLIIAGTAHARAPFEATRLTVRVDALEPHWLHLLARGAQQLNAIQPTPVGAKMRFRHPDGLIVEYVEHHERASERRPSGER